MKAADIRACLVNLKKVENSLADLSLKTTNIKEKKVYHDSMLTVSEVINDIKDRLIRIEETPVPSKSN
ncbi:DUF1657 domain-containing protein [Jeotgalibacillus sp. S-D1]|uniref:DUF1657 domain-containing protein n=1 Tax=Jeotgalibacillus sp. S-D1 TaxID=2552189 RepID=UPI0014043FFB|nr:DUF1657 domain-containing protein [Jeotgalibacillus sp. S-D1]